MANTATNVTAGKPKVGGAIFRAPLGTTLPTDATAALDAAFVGLGYMSDDGLSYNGAVTVEDYQAWGGDTVLSEATEVTDEWALTAIEALNTEVLKAYHGDSNVTGTLSAGITVKSNATLGEAACWVFELLLKGGAVRRVVLPNAKLSERGEVQYVDGEPVGYPMTVRGMADSAGNTHYEYTIKAS